MRQCDVAVVGLGLMGSAALDALLHAGADALGFDPLSPGAKQGSSHGSCRVFRRYNFENTNYTRLSAEAQAGWDRLASASGKKILIPCPVLEAGLAPSEMVRASRQAALDQELADPSVSIAEANARFPAFRLPKTWEAVIQDGGAILQAQLALEALRARATAEGRVFAERPRIAPGPDHAVLYAAGEAILAKRIILATGPWLGTQLSALKLEPELKLQVTRQVVGWFQPARPADVALGRFPLFILARSKDDIVYGFPDFEDPRRGVKAAPHNHGAEVGPDAWGPQASDEELAQVSSALAELVPGAAGPIGDRDVCLYTNTPGSDLPGDGGNEFIIDRWPNSPFIICSACSGHGAKFAPAIGERLARLALEPSFEVETFFRLSRIPGFSRQS